MICEENPRRILAKTTKSNEAKIMTVVLELKPEVEEALQNKAKAKGFEVNVYVEKLIEKDVDHSKTLDEILAPVHKEFEESGMSEDELLEFFEEVREEVWQEKQKQNEGK